MENRIDIKEDFLSLDNLMSAVNTDKDFTLMDVFQFVKRGNIPFDILGIIIQCYCVEDLIKEIESKPFTPDDYIDHLELSWIGNKDKWGCMSTWEFDGKGRIGEMSEELKEHFKYLKKEIPADWIQGYAIEFTELWKLSGYVIKINPEIYISDWEKWNKKDEESIKEYNIEFKPTIKVIELIYNIFWELSFAGDPTERNEKHSEIKQLYEECKKSRNEKK